MTQLQYSYNYRRSEETYTLDQFISCQSDSDVCYNNLSFIDQIDNIQYCAYNIVSDYIDEIIDTYCVKVQLSSDDMIRYMYRPKLLCYDVYGSTELHFIILLLNDICSVKEFTKDLLYMPSRVNMATVCNALLNANKSSIDKYNKSNKVTTEYINEKRKYE